MPLKTKSRILELDYKPTVGKIAPGDSENFFCSARETTLGQRSVTTP